MSKKWHDPPTAGEIFTHIAFFFSSIAALIGLLIHSLVDRLQSEKVEPPTPYTPPNPQTAHAQTAEVIAAANFPTPQQFSDAFYQRMMGDPRLEKLDPKILKIMLTMAVLFYKEEHFSDPPNPLTGAITGIEAARYADELELLQKKFVDPPKTLQTFTEITLASFVLFAEHLPKLPTTENPLCTVTLSDSIPDIGRAIWDTVLPFYASPATELGLFQEITPVLMSGQEHKDKAVPPHEHKGTTQEILDTYLCDSPFDLLFRAKVPFDFTEKLGEHALLLASTGWGKSQLIQCLTVHLLSQLDPPSIIILNSQGTMLEKLQRLSIFAPGQPLSDRLVLIDPEHEDPPALNMFALPTDRTKTYSRNIREQLEVGTTETFTYLLSSIAVDLTGKQTTAFNYLITLVLSMPNASFNVFLDVLQEQTKDPNGKSSKYAPYIDKLDLNARGFFENQYFTKAFTETRQQIGQRIYRTLNLPAFSRMFGATENKLDLFNLMQSGSVILVNTSKTLLGDQGSAFFGRWIVSLLIRAAYERIAVKNPRRTLLLIDEASDYVDQSFEKILSKVRQFNVGCLMAFQDTSQIPILRPLLSNTSVKLAGGVSDHDARAIASDMRTDKDFLMSMKQTKKSAEFATHVRGMTSAVRIEIPYFTVENAPKMTDSELAQLIERNRERYSASPTHEPATVASTETPSQPATMAQPPRDIPASPPTSPADDDAHTTPSKDY